MDQMGIVGDQSFGVDLPVTEVDESDLVAEKNMAKFSRTKEFKALKDHVESRIKFYQTFLPDGRVVGVGERPTGDDWLVANTVIAEFNALISSYESASQSVQAKRAG